MASTAGDIAIHPREYREAAAGTFQVRKDDASFFRIWPSVAAVSSQTISAIWIGAGDPGDGEQNSIGRAGNHPDLPEVSGIIGRRPPGPTVRTLWACGKKESRVLS